MLLIVLCNAPPDEALTLAETLIYQRLAACVNVIPNVTSFYHWDNQLQVDTESTLLIKVTEKDHAQLVAKLEELHSYDVPEIITISPHDVSQSYLNWAISQTETPDKSQ